MRCRVTECGRALLFTVPLMMPASTQAGPLTCDMREYKPLADLSAALEPDWS